MPALLFVEAFGQLTQDANLKGIVSEDEEDLYSVFLSRSELMGWATTSPRRHSMLWNMHEADLTSEDDAFRIGWVQVGLDVGNLEPALPAPRHVQGFAYAPLSAHRRDIEPALVLPALIQCFVDALRRFGVVELSGFQVTANFLDSRTQSYARDIISALNWFNIAPHGRANALITFDEKFLRGSSEAELVASLRRRNTGSFEFGPVVAVPEQHSVKAYVETPVLSVSPTLSGLGISVTLPEWTPSAAGWVLASVIDAARLINPDASNFAVRLTRIR